MRTRNRSQRRRGATAVEFSLVAPPLFLFVLAGIEFSRANLVSHTCTIAAIEGARRGIVPGASADECRDRALEELSIVGVTDVVIEVVPDPIKLTDETISVSVTAPANVTNGFAVIRYFLGKSLRGSATLRRETPDFEYSLPPESGGGGHGGGGGDDD